MNRYPYFLFILVGISGLASANSTPPTHCLSNEFSVVNAWMGPIKATGGGWNNTKEGKYLSLCADKQIEPFATLTYRYGVAGNVEFEAVATDAQKFFIYNRQTSPHTADDIIFFTKGKYTYYVAIAGGQGHGVSLRVYQDKKLMLYRFSGNSENDDYSVGPAEVNFSGGTSTILKYKTPAHSF